MWWDIIPIGPDPDDTSCSSLDSAVLDVLTRTLALDSIACQEAALHGLGHWHFAYPEETKSIIDTYLAEARPEGPLLEYARQARAGHVL
jgi:hypothetical protein